MKSKLIVRIVCIILAVLLVGSVFAMIIPYIAHAAGMEGYISDDYVNLRSGAGTGYSVVACLREDTKVTFESTETYNSDWYKVTEQGSGKTGYVHKNYVSRTEDSSGSSASSGSTGYISDDYVNLRSGAGTGNSVVKCLRENTKFTFVSTSPTNGWYNIKLSDGTTGWVLGDYLTADKKQEEKKDDDTPSTSASTGYVNTDYVNLRKGAGTGNAVVTCMRENTKFTLVSENPSGDWYHVKLSNGTDGWVIKDYITIQKSSTKKDDEPDSGMIRLSSSSETNYKGNEYALTAYGIRNVTWSSSDSSVASVNSDGVVTAKSAGTAKITAKSGSDSASCSITVKSGSSVNISCSEIENMRRGKSVLLKSTTSGVRWKSSNEKIATVNSGIVDTKSENGFVTITAYTSSGAATCLIEVIGRDNIRFVYATPNSAYKGSEVTFHAITDTDRVDLYFVVSNGSTSYTVDAKKEKTESGTVLWTASQKLNESGKWTYKAYSKFVDYDKYLTTPVNGEGEVLVADTTDLKTTVTGERRASEDVIEMIAEFEGFLPDLIPDPITGESDMTIGYGLVFYANDQFYNHLTKTEAYAYLCQSVNKDAYTSRTNAFLTSNNVKFNQQQFDALVCFTYNVGAYAITNDDDLRSILLNTSTGASSASVTAGGNGYVSGSGVNLRSDSSTGSSVLTTMGENTKFTFVDGKLVNSHWYKIKLSNETVGYIYSDYAASESAGGTRDLNNIDAGRFIQNLLQYHHAAGECYWGLLYRRVDEAEMFLFGDYEHDGSRNKYNFDFTCYRNSSFSI